MDPPSQTCAILFGKEGDCFTGPSGTTSSTDSMNVTGHGAREVIVDNQVHSLEIQTTTQEIRGDKNPNLPQTKVFDDSFSLIE